MSGREGEETPKNPLRAILDIRRKELPLALAMFGYFFVVISVFWILKPIKKTILVSFYEARPLDLFGWVLDGPQVELLAKVANMLVAALAVVVFSLLSKRLHRERLSLVFCAFFAVALAFYAFFVESPSHWLAWSFYLFGDLWTTVMVATFFAFLNDSVTPKAAKRLYGLIVLGGVAGGAFGSSVLRIWIEAVSRSQWMWIGLGATALIAVLAKVAGVLVDRGVVADADPPDPSPPMTKKEMDDDETRSAALEGARLVLRSPYLLAIAGLVGLYEIVSTVLDFQFTSTIVHYLESEQAIETQFATVFTITNIASLVVQLVITTFVMNRYRLTVALLVTPAVMLAASGAFVALPILWVGSLLNTADNAFSYSINQSARETLYTPTSKSEKYRAKAFIDMFVQRFAKSIAVGVALLVSTVFTDFGSVRWLSLFVIAVVALWILVARYAGKRFHERTKE